MKIKILVFCALFFLLAKSAFAVSPVDLTVTCSASSCGATPANGAALFNETNLAPGQTITKKIEVVNNNPNDDCALAMTVKNPQDPGSLAGVMATAINDGSTPLYSDSFVGLFPTKTINMGVVPKFGEVKTYDWLVTFSAAADNRYQDQIMKFDFDLAFTCGVPPPAPAGENSQSNSSGGGASPPPCNDSAPLAPTGFSAVLGTNSGEVNLAWTAPASAYTYFLVAYSDSSTWPPKWGNPSVGNGTAYTVAGLGSGTYWFWVRAGNGCQPGPFVGPISPGTVSGTGGVATNFSPGVLGTQENLNTGLATQSPQLEKVKGESTAACTSCFWWPLLILQALLIFLKRRSLKWSVVVSIFVFLVFLWLNRSCPLSGVCKYFWLLDLGVLLLGLLYSKIKRDETL